MYKIKFTHHLFIFLELYDMIITIGSKIAILVEDVLITYIKKWLFI
jgi:hypothetical protein